MAKFSFRLQSVLNIKASLEEQQKLSFASARKSMDEALDKLDELFKRLEFYEDEGRRMRNEVLVLRDILDNEEAIVKVKEYIENQKDEVKRREALLEEERLKLVEAMRERKTYEKLRERAFAEYLEEEKHAEAVENDEHNSFVYGQKNLTP